MRYRICAATLNSAGIDKNISIITTIHITPEATAPFFKVHDKIIEIAPVNKADNKYRSVHAPNNCNAVNGYDVNGTTI